MIRRILNSLVSDSRKLTEKGFFALSTTKRQQALEKLWGKTGFEELRKYLAKVSGDQYLSDLISFQSSGEREPSDLASAVAAVLTDDLSAVMDRLPIGYYMNSKEERKRNKALSGLGSGSALQDAIKEIVLSREYHEIVRSVAKFVEQAGMPVAKVQTASDLTADLKHEIRRAMAKKYKGTYVVFEIDRTLLGGIRVFREGRMLDHSWRSLVSRALSV